MKRKPYKFTDKKKKEYLDLLRDGGRRHASARSVGISPWTAVNHMNEDEEFRNEVELAEMEANERVEDALFMAAESGNVTAIQVWLYNRAPDRWTDKRNPPKTDDSTEALEKLVKAIESNIQPEAEGDSK